MTGGTTLRIDREKLWNMIAEMGEIGKGAAGRTRLALSWEDLEARRLLARWMEDLGLDVQTDAYANIWGVRAGRDAKARPVVVGSHIDTVRDAGMFDGVMGVLSGLAAVRAMNEAKVETERPVAVISFTDEEGGRFLSGGLAGSRALAGLTDIETLKTKRSPEGKSWVDALNESGFVGNGRLEPHAYLEYHIEQGPALADENIQIGVVRGVVGISWLRVTFRGEANHAGAFPMNRRHDAGLAAARAVVELNRLALELGQGAVITPGQLNQHPNLPNIVPGEVVLTVDIRQFDPVSLEHGVNRLKEVVRTAGEQEGVAVKVETLVQTARAAFSEEMVSLVERKARELGYSTKRMSSGAGHDAQILHGLCPTGMIFVPSKDGRSHCPEEFTSQEDMGNGADVLLQCVLELTGPFESAD
ncbi:MAG: M20 family metallo-hydrolase [Synergistaceae bacterium]|jgi:N-carbamoyl-L-amino-acid hydrolase|nr:M20 family metallo-hydrolase [Synergistaceae bacterium]